MKAVLTEYNQDDDAQDHVAHESLHFVLDEQNSLSDAEGSGDKRSDHVSNRILLWNID